MSRIYLSPPEVRGTEADLLLGALRSGWVAPVGPDLDAFEAELAAQCGVAHAVGLSSGTAALHLALLDVGVQAGDDVLVPTLTFVATANAVTYCGARPCFIEVDPTTWQLSPQLLAEELAERAATSQLPAAVISVDLYGNCVDHGAVLAICDDYGVAVVEDAAEAIGATWNNRPAGSFGDCGVLSFNGNKLITTAGGGALLCHDIAQAERTRYLATQARLPSVHYQHTEVGFNYRLSNLLAALGRGQLATLDDRIARRRQIRSHYQEALGHLPGVGFPAEHEGSAGNAWLTCIILEPGVATGTPEGLRRHLEIYDIESRPVWKPMHLQPLYKNHPARVDGSSDRIFATGVCLPSGSGMNDDDLERVVSVTVDYLLRVDTSRGPEVGTL